MVPLAIVAEAGDTEMLTSAALLTVSVTPVEVTVPEVAVMVALPAATPFARPWLPAELEMLAVAVAEEAHVTELVRSWVDPSEYVPTASNCCVVPLAIVGALGVTAMLIRKALLTARVVLPEMEPEAAVMVTPPSLRPLARPTLPAELEMLAMVESDEVQVTVVRVWTLLSE